MSWLDIEAWSRLFSVKLTPYDVTIIRVIDTAWFMAQATERDRQGKAKDRDAAKTRRR